MLSNILVPVDGSENSFRALEHAIFLSTKIQGVKIAVIYIMEDLPTVYIYSPKIMKKINEDYKRESEKILERCKEMTKKEEIDIHSAILKGDPASKIIEYSEKQRSDIIIMGRSGMGKFKEALIGSISNKVLHHTKCSVMFVR
jgi:nucleotide-binding universal stress UspA family protein